jgi:hypothetical protein
VTAVMVAIENCGPSVAAARSDLISAAAAAIHFDRDHQMMDAVPRGRRTRCRAASHQNRTALIADHYHGGQRRWTAVSGRAWADLRRPKLQPKLADQHRCRGAVVVEPTPENRAFHPQPVLGPHDQHCQGARDGQADRRYGHWSLRRCRHFRFAEIRVYHPKTLLAPHDHHSPDVRDGQDAMDGLGAQDVRGDHCDAH